MAPTQFDIIRRQGEAAAKNQAERAAAGLRRETSLVGMASRLTGKAFVEGEQALRGGLFRRRSSPRPMAGDVVPTEAQPVRPAPDGYIRRSPVQPVYEAADYRRRLLWRAVGVVVVIAAALVGVYFLGRLGLLGR